MIPGGNTDLPKGMKSTGKGNHRGEYMFFLGGGWEGGEVTQHLKPLEKPSL